MNQFNYMLLGRLESDCKYYLGFGAKSPNVLWANNEKEQIEKMKEIYNNFPENEKPQWLTYDKILEYEKLMCNNS